MLIRHVSSARIFFICDIVMLEKNTHFWLNKNKELLGRLNEKEKNELNQIILENKGNRPKAKKEAALFVVAKHTCVWNDFYNKWYDIQEKLNCLFFKFQINSDENIYLNHWYLMHIYNTHMFHNKDIFVNDIQELHMLLKTLFRSLFASKYSLKIAFNWKAVIENKVFTLISMDFQWEKRIFKLLFWKDNDLFWYKLVTFFEDNNRSTVFFSVSKQDSIILQEEIRNHRTKIQTINALSNWDDTIKNF